MSHVGEWRLSLELGRYHLRLYGLSVRRCAVAFLILILVVAAVEIGRALMLVRATVLRGGLVSVSSSQLVDVAEAYICVPGDHLTHVCGGVLVQLLVAAEDKDGDVDRAEDGELVRLLEQAALSLEKGAVRDADG